MIKKVLKEEKGAEGWEKSYTWGTWTKCEVLSSVLAVLHYRP
jgi:hypothetical protein